MTGFESGPALAPAVLLSLLPDLKFLRVSFFFSAGLGLETNRGCSCRAACRLSHLRRWRRRRLILELFRAIDKMYALLRAPAACFSNSTLTACCHFRSLSVWKTLSCLMLPSW